MPYDGAFHDLGELPNASGETVAPTAPKTPYYPYVTIAADKLPELAEYEVGEDVTLLVKGVIVGHEIREREGDDKTDEYRIELQEAACRHEGDHAVAAETGMPVKNAKLAREHGMS